MNKKRSGKSRLEQMKLRIEELTFSMQLFCLNPKLEKFLEICKCDSLVRKEADDFKIWKLSCLYKYGRDWELEFDPEDRSKSIDNIEFNFQLHEKSLCDKAIENPSQSTSLRILHIFFATGELKYIDLYYQCMGHENLPESTRRYLVSVYHTIKEKYQLEVIKLLTENKNHFDNLDLVQSTVDFSYFDDAKERAIREKKRIEQHNKMITSLQQKTHSSAPIDDAQELSVDIEPTEKKISTGDKFYHNHKPYFTGKPGEIYGLN